MYIPPDVYISNRVSKILFRENKNYFSFCLRKEGTCLYSTVMILTAVAGSYLGLPSYVQAQEFPNQITNLLTASLIDHMVNAIKHVGSN